MKILHIFNNTNEKFSEPFIEFINSNFEKLESSFIILGEDNRINKIQRNNVKFVEKRVLFKILTKLYSADKIILHALMSPFLVGLLFLQPWLLKKCNWVVWGADLYYYKFKRQRFRSNIYEWIRKFVIKRMGGLITHIRGDYDLAKSWYGAKGKYYYSFMYPSNLYKEYDLSHVSKDHDKIYIQIGNSADSTNNHLEVFEKLKEYKGESIEIICPLSYGNVGHRDKVIKEGKRIFGEKFTPITTFMPFEEYLGLLAKIDIAIFNHKRQQAMGNITTLLGLGKKVYIRDDITTWKFCKEHELKVYNLKNFDELLKGISVNEKSNNIENVKKFFSEKKLKKDLQKIFSDK